MSAPSAFIHLSRGAAVTAMALATLAGAPLLDKATAATPAAPRVAAAAAMASAAAPGCDAMPGPTAALNDRWRVFWDRPTDVRKVSLFACRRGAGPAGSVIKLGRMRQTYNRCFCVEVRQIEGDRVLLAKTYYDGPILPVETLALVNLADGTKAELGPRANAGDSLRLLPGGGLLWDEYTESGPTRTPGASVIEDARGRTVVDPGGVQDVAESADGVLYGARPDGSVMIIRGEGAAQLSWTPVPSLQARPIGALRGRPHRGRLIAFPGAGELRDIAEGRGSRAKRFIDYGYDRVVIRRSGAIRVLATAYAFAIVEAPFVGSPGFTVRRIGVAKRRNTAWPVDIRPAPQPGEVAVDMSGRVAVGTPDGLRYGGPVLRDFAAGAARSVASREIWQEDKGTFYVRLYFTDADGTARTATTAPEGP